MAKTPPEDRQPRSAKDHQDPRHLAREDTPTPVIALKLGRTPAAVQAEASTQGISLKLTNQSPYDGRKL